jgi:hypothetical protein
VTAGQVRDIVRAKLRCEHQVVGYDPSNVNHIFSVLAHRICLEPCRRGSEAMQLAESAVESHLRVIAGCDAPSGYFQTLSQAEPIVSEAATALLMGSHNHWENTMREPNDKPLNAGLTDRGPSGELVVRLLCILAHDAVLSESSQPHEADRPEWAQSFSVRTFLAALCRKAKTVLELPAQPFDGGEQHLLQTLQPSLLSNVQP